MTAQVQPETTVRINLARGIVSLIGQAAAKIPHGKQVWDGGLHDVVKQAIEACGVPTEDITALEAARRLGILPAEKNRTRKR